MKRLLSTLIMFLALATTSLAGDVTLAWDQSPTPGVTMNRLWYGPSTGNYTLSQSFPAATTYTLRGLPSGIWFFAVTAITADGAESDKSNEVSTTVPPDPPKPEPPSSLKKVDVTVNLKIVVN